MAHLVVWRGRWVKEFSHCGFPLCSLICKIYEISSLHMLFSLGSFFFFLFIGFILILAPHLFTILFLCSSFHYVSRSCMQDKAYFLFENCTFASGKYFTLFFPGKHLPRHLLRLDTHGRPTKTPLN